MYLQDNGAHVDVTDDPDRAAYRAEVGVPETAASCHTATVEGYVIEGHVPVGAIVRLLESRPDAIGLALPGMPADSPGMGGDETTWERQPVMLIEHDGSLRLFDATVWSPPDATTGPTTGPEQLAGWAAGSQWGPSGIGRACVAADGDVRAACTSVVHDPSGVPISYDPTTRTLIRHAGGDEVRAVLPEDLGADVALVAAGPDQVVYLDIVVQPGTEGSADLVAVALAAGDAGRVLERGVGAGNPGSDADFVVTPDGLVTTDWYGQGRRPAADRPLAMAWVDRDDDDPAGPGAATRPNGVAAITIDAYEHTVTVDGRTWRLTGQAAEFAPTGMPPIVRTFDGGFIARYDETAGGYRSIVVRGWPDGSVDEWVVPGGVPGATVLPEPMGTVLIADGEHFARAVAFEPRLSAWAGGLMADAATGHVDVAALAEHLATLDPSAPRPPWDIAPVAFADAAAGPRAAPFVLRTVTHVAQDGAVSIVTVVDEVLPGDSVAAIRLTLTIADLQRVEAIEWATSCRPGHGHQQYQSAPCT